MKRQLKKSVVNGLYVISFTLLVGGIVLLGVLTKKADSKNYEYVSKGILDYEEYVQVVTTTPTIVRPYIDSNINVVKNYYDYLAESKLQEESLIYYEGTYIQSSGVSYSNGNVFDVISILNGTVKEVKEDATLGNIITIEHENGITSIYQSVSDIAVSTGDSVTQGQLIAKSSTSNISTELNNHLYFELIVNGECVNPENYYNKAINEI